MKLKFNVNFPQKSIFGFKILSSLKSTISCYFLLFFGKVLSLFFGLSKIQILAGIFFNVLLDMSIVILIINLFIKRNELRRFNFIFLNLFLFIYLPVALHNIFNGIFQVIKFF